MVDHRQEQEDRRIDPSAILSKKRLAFTMSMQDVRKSIANELGVEPERVVVKPNVTEDCDIFGRPTRGYTVELEVVLQPAKGG